MAAMTMKALLRGELILTVNILVGLAFGDLILRWGLAERLMKKLLPRLRRMGIGPVLGMALAVSFGSSKAGAGILAAALEEGKISRRTALWGTLSLAFPAYLHRWPVTLTLAAGTAGPAGVVFALVLLLRSALRFGMVLFFLKGRDDVSLGDEDAAELSAPREIRLYRRLVKTLPLAWLFYAVAWLLVPWLDSWIRSSFLGAGSFLPTAGWAVAASAIASLAPSLAMAGGSLASGDLNLSQAVFALLLGNGLGTVTRVLRQNTGYYFGLFSGDLARKMLFCNIATMLPLVMLSLLIAAAAMFW